MSSPDRAPARNGALPDGWGSLWAQPLPFLRNQLSELRQGFASLAAEVPLRDEHSSFGGLVGSADLRDEPVHRWFAYKEGYSPKLPPRVVQRVGVGGGTVADTFGGLATTALSLRTHPQVAAIRSVEYSPLAHFVGVTKLNWVKLSPRKLSVLSKRLIDYPVDPTLPAPSLAAFDNDEIFPEEVLASLVSAREHLRTIEMKAHERDFFMLGLAAIVEDVSGAMKDGRALRILRGRKRTPSALWPKGR